MKTCLGRAWHLAALLGALAASTTAHAATFVVTNTSGSAGTVGSLPWAILQANSNGAGADFIHFNIPGPGVKVITITDTLFLNGQTVVDAKTQPGYAGTPLVYVHGGAGVASIFLLHLDSDGSTIQGVGMFNFTSNGVTLLNSSQGNWIQDNWIGFFQAAGGPVQRNSDLNAFTRGIGLQSSFNTIRGNTISGVDNAITIGEDISGWSGTFYRTNSIERNRIGVSPTSGSCTGYGNTGDGIFFGSGARENFVGPVNIIGCNAEGIELLHSSNVGNVIFSNGIGCNASTPLPNRIGVLLANGANGNAVGGAFGGNLISGNSLGGVALGTGGFGGANGNWVQNNLIGLNLNQTAPLGPQFRGVTIDSGSTQNAVEGNVIAGHSDHGVLLANVTTNSVSQNRIGINSGGTHIANAAFGIFFFQASYNFATNNIFGTNTLGNIGQQGSCCNQF